MMVFEQMRAAVEAAAPDRLGEVASAIWQAYGAGGLTDEDAEQLDGLLSARRRAGAPMPTKARSLADVAARVDPAAVPSPAVGGGSAPRRAASRAGTRPRKPESTARKRRMAAGGYLPPALAQGFTQGEQAVLAVVALEAVRRGACTLCLGHIAALAGVSERTVRRAYAQARILGLLTVEERRLSYSRSDTNVVRVASREWAAWLRLRLPGRGSLGGGRQSGPTAPIRVLDQEAAAARQPRARAERVRLARTGRHRDL